jgi:hypothetical protein
MAAVYPGNIRSFTTKVNVTEIIDASHPNVIQDEVVAIQNTLGTNPATSTTPGTTFISTANAFATVKARLANIEAGLVADIHPQYVKVTGGSTINASGAAVKPLVIRGAAGQTANLQEWQQSNGTVVAYIDPNGVFNAATVFDIDNLYILSWVFN